MAVILVAKGFLGGAQSRRASLNTHLQHQPLEELVLQMCSTTHSLAGLLGACLFADVSRGDELSMTQDPCP